MKTKWNCLLCGEQNVNNLTLNVMTVVLCAECGEGHDIEITNKEEGMYIDLADDCIYEIDVSEEDDKRIADI